jgi:transposase
MELTDAQWELLKSIVEPKTPAKRRGRPWKETRAVLEGVLWILRTGAQWAELPAKFPPYQTCHRRFQAWVRAGVLVQLLRLLAEDLLARGQLDLA